MRSNYPKMCKNCAKSFIGRKNQIYCNKKCLQTSYRNNFEKLKYNHLSSGTIGAIQELKAAVDLMDKGYEVYRALSPSSSCDLLAIKDGQVFDFEVRTAYKNAKTNELMYPPKNIKAKNLILVTPNEIIYIFNYIDKKTI